MGRNPKKAGKKAKAKGGGGGGERMKDVGADDSDFELEDGVTVVTGETDDEMDEDGSGRCVPSHDTRIHRPMNPFYSHQPAVRTTPASKSDAR
jgi:hypothetical protein